MSTTRMYYFDSGKLCREFEKRKLIATEVAEEMGFNHDYFSTCMYRSRISHVAVKFLESKYNIRYADYRLDEKPTPIEKQSSEAQSTNVTVEMDIDYEQLHDTIYDAVYRAVKKAWAE